nr:DUF4760 domain-containing protein [Ferrimonas balearica]
MENITRILLFVASIVAIEFYIGYKVGSDFYSASAILISATLALSAALINTKYQRQTARESNSLNFQQTLQQDAEYHKNLSIIIEAIHNRHKVPLESFALEEFGQSKEATAIRYVLNTWERASLAMVHKVYDEAYLYGAHKSMVLHFGVVLRSYIRKTQEKNVSLYCHFNWLVLRWTIRRDSFSEKQTKDNLKKIFSDLDRVGSGKLMSHQK